jgi:hypothetical protein
VVGNYPNGLRARLLLMKSLERPLPLKNAPLQYAPENEFGVVFMFSQIAKKLQFRIEKVRAAYPDCIAYRPSCW